jgi:hypothetical protein
LPAPAACTAWAAAGSANGTTSGRHTVPFGGTRVVSRYLLTLASMQAEATSEVWPQPARVSSREFGSSRSTVTAP